MSVRAGNGSPGSNQGSSKPQSLMFPQQLQHLHHTLSYHPEVLHREAPGMNAKVMETMDEYTGHLSTQSLWNVWSRASHAISSGGIYTSLGVC